MGEHAIATSSQAMDYMADYPGFGEMRSFTDALGAEQLAFTWRSMPPGTGGKGSYGHRHRTQEEVYFVIRGNLAFKVGDEVFGGQSGAFAEYVRVAEHGAVVHKPANVTMEQAAAVPIAGVTALQALRDHGRLQPGQNVLINGASGGVGTFAVQIARALGGEVTAVCSTSHVETVRAIGAQHVVDYTREDFTRLGQHFDLLLDIAGSRSFAECARVLAPNATFVAVGSATHMQSGAWKVLQHLAAVRFGSLRSKRRVVIFVARMTRSDLLVLQDLMASGKVTPIIDKRYPLSDVRAAFAYLGQGHAAGKVVLDIPGA